MAVRIRSLLVSGPVVIPLNTGRNVRLSPGESSAELHDVEVADNAKVDKLVRQGVIQVDDAAKDDAAKESTAKESTAKESTAKESTAKESTAPNPPKARKRSDSAE